MAQEEVEEGEIRDEEVPVVEVGKKRERSPSAREREERRRREDDEERRRRRKREEEEDENRKRRNREERDHRGREEDRRRDGRVGYRNSRERSRDRRDRGRSDGYDRRRPEERGGRDGWRDERGREERGREGGRRGDSRQDDRRDRRRDGQYGHDDRHYDSRGSRRSEEREREREKEREKEREEEERKQREYEELVRQQIEKKQQEEEAVKKMEEEREERRKELLRLALASRKEQEEEERREKERQEKERTANGSSASLPTKEEKEEEEKEEEKEEEGDEDDINLFSDSPIKPILNVSSQAAGLGVAGDWDDPEGYLKFRIGEMLDGRYRVIGCHGKGVFSTVLKAVDTLDVNDREVAIKVNRNNETMKTAGEQERDFLVELAEHKNNRFCISLLSWFEYKSHLCLVLETMEANLRDVIRQYGTGVGISVQAVQVYSQQLLHALKVLKQCAIVHADIKPDNIVVSSDKKLVKICDFGTGLRSTEENAITPLLVSRFYRPPEVILGLPYDEQVDIWSVGCCMAEMYTGRILFRGRDNNHMLRLFMQIKGMFPKKLLRRAAFASEHFDLSDGTFTAHEADVVDAEKIVLRKMHIGGPEVDLLTLLAPDTTRIPPATMVKVKQLKDLLERIFLLDPKKRITVEDALKHPFLAA